MAEVIIRGERYILDDEDLERVGEHSWVLDRYGAPRTWITHEKVVVLSRFLTGYDGPAMVKFANGDRRDYRKANIVYGRNRIVDGKLMIPLRGEWRECLVDPDVLEEIVPLHSWHMNNSGYVKASINLKKEGGSCSTIFLHRLILPCDPGLNVDHIDRDKLNNLRSNLRIATNAQNSYNRVAFKSSVTGIPGVRPQNNGRDWCAAITINGRQRMRTFSVKKYGAEGAFEMAVAERRRMEAEAGIEAYIPPPTTLNQEK
jgi:hypothetical protein